MFTVGNHVIFYTFIPTERIRIVIIISLIPRGIFFKRQSADTSSFFFVTVSMDAVAVSMDAVFFHTTSSKVFARGFVENHSA